MKNQKLIIGTLIGIGGLAFFIFYLPNYKKKWDAEKKAKELATYKRQIDDSVEVMTAQSKIMADLYKDPNFIWGSPIPADVQKKLDDIVLSKDYQDMQDNIKASILKEASLSNGKIIGSFP